MANNKPRIYSVSEINSVVKEKLRIAFPHLIWLRGEIQGYNKNKHKNSIFFQLCEKYSEKNELIAEVKAVIFEQNKKKIIKRLNEIGNEFELQDDIEVQLLCKINFWARKGQFSVIVVDLEPAYTLGKLAQDKKKKITMLKKQGILDRNKETTIPLVPLNVGLITAYNSSAYHDFTNELKKSRFSFKIYIFNSFMQGKNVERDICKALDIFNANNFLDIVVITRGGGSTTDLSWFDNEKIAKKIAFSRLPVLSGIGHETDITIADLASKIYKKTPTAIAQHIIQKVEDYNIGIDKRAEELIAFVDREIKRSKDRLKTLSINTNIVTNEFLKVYQKKIIQQSETIRGSTFNFIHNMEMKVSNQEKNLSSSVKQSLRYVREYINFLKEKIEFQKIKKILFRIMSEVIKKEKALGDSVKKNIKSKKEKIKAYEAVIKIADPLNTLKRGFSITKTKSGSVIRSLKDTKIGEKLVTIIFDGKITSDITKKEDSYE